MRGEGDTSTRTAKRAISAAHCHVSGIYQGRRLTGKIMKSQRCVKAGREVAVFRDRLYICIFKSTALHGRPLFRFFEKRPLRDVTPDRCHRWPHKFSSRKGRVRFEVNGGRDTIRIAFDCFQRRTFAFRRNGIEIFNCLVVEVFSF